MLNYQVQSYKDYRKFLTAVFQFEKAAAKSNFSKKQFAQKIGLSDSNYRMICSGQRNLTPENAVTISKNLKFSTTDTEYFINLVYLSNLKNLDAKHAINQQLKRLELDAKSKQLNTSYQEFILDSKLQATVIFIKDMNLDLASNNIVGIVAKKFNFTLKETKIIIEKIREIGVPLDDPKHFHIIYSKLSNSLSRGEYLKNEFLMAAQLTKNSTTPGFLFSAKTFSISKNRIDSFAQEYKKLTEKYMILSTEGESDLEVVRVLFHLRPLTAR